MRSSEEKTTRMTGDVTMHRGVDYACFYATCHEYPVAVVLCQECGARFTCASHLGWLRRHETQSHHFEVLAQYALVKQVQ
jgi:hypothetical protein